jgi:hypothetical protein
MARYQREVMVKAADIFPSIFALTVCFLENHLTQKIDTKYRNGSQMHDTKMDM